MKKNMKMIMLTYNHALDEEMMDLLTEAGVSGFTKIENITGSGDSGPHMGTNIWPATNSILFIAATAEGMKTLKKKGKLLADKFEGEGMRGFVFNLAEMW